MSQIRSTGKSVSENYFEALPIEILIDIFSYLNPENIPASALISKSFYSVSQAQLLWKRKFSIHFPYLLKRISKKKKDTNWYKKFCDAYQAEYQHLTQRNKKLLSLLKESDFENLEGKLEFSDLLCPCHRQDQTTIMRWTINQGSQALKNYIYSMVTKGYQIDTPVDTLKDEQKATRLHWAVLLNQTEEIKSLISQDVNVNAVNTYDDIYYNTYRCYKGTTPLHIAAQLGHVESVNLLIEKGANVNAANEDGITPIHLALKESDVEIVNLLEIVKLLIENGANVNTGEKYGLTILAKAVCTGHIEIVKLLLENGANVNAPNNPPEYQDSPKPLHMAIVTRHVEIAKLLLKNGANVNALCSTSLYYGTPLTVAVLCPAPEMVELLLLEPGVNTEDDGYDGEGETLLHLALTRNNVDTNDDAFEVVKLLLQKEGADINAACSPNGRTALYAAAKSGIGAFNSVKFLLKQGAEVNLARTNDGATPLHVAAKYNHIEIVKLLLKKGANVNAARRDDGATPLHVAAKKGHAEIFTLLLAAAKKDHVESVRLLLTNVNPALDDDTMLRRLSAKITAIMNDQLEIGNSLFSLLRRQPPLSHGSNQNTLQPNIPMNLTTNTAFAMNSFNFSPPATSTSATTLNYFASNTSPVPFYQPQLSNCDTNTSQFNIGMNSSYSPLQLSHGSNQNTLQPNIPMNLPTNTAFAMNDFNCSPPATTSTSTTTPSCFASNTSPVHFYQPQLNNCDTNTSQFNTGMNSFYLLLNMNLTNAPVTMNSLNPTTQTATSHPTTTIPPYFTSNDSTENVTTYDLLQISDNVPANNKNNKRKKSDNNNDDDLTDHETKKRKLAENSPSIPPAVFNNSNSSSHSAHLHTQGMFNQTLNLQDQKPGIKLEGEHRCKN